MVNRRSTIPPYQQVAADIRARIASGDLPPGWQLPAYSTLAHQYEVGIGTITRAVQLLRDAGLVETGTGTPSYIRDAPVRKTANVPAGSTVTSRMPTPAEREQFDIEAGVPVMEVADPSGKVTLYPADRWRLTFGH